MLLSMAVPGLTAKILARIQIKSRFVNLDSYIKRFGSQNIGKLRTQELV